MGTRGGVETVDLDGVRRLMDSGAQIVEVLPKAEYEQEHLLGAIHIRLRDIGRRANELHRSRPVVVYCFDSQ
jgi:rhodanese-related sulfurtransferase